MKGLMLKELYLSRKLRIIGIAVWFVVILFCVLIRISALYGNIALFGEESAKNAETIAWAIMVFGESLLLYSMQFTNSADADEKSGFRVYEHTLPISEKKIVGAVYLTNLCAFAAVTAVNYITALSACLLFDRSFDPMYLVYILGIGCLAYMLVHFKAALTYMMRNPKKGQMIFTIFCMGIYFGGAFGFMNWFTGYYGRFGVDSGMSEAEKDAVLEAQGLTETSVMNDFLNNEVMGVVRWFGSNAWWLVPVIVGGVTAVCYYLSVRGLKRRGGRC